MFGARKEGEKAEKFFVNNFLTWRDDERSEESSSVNEQTRSFEECVCAVKLIIYYKCPN